MQPPVPAKAGDLQYQDVIPEAAQRLSGIHDVDCGQRPSWVPARATLGRDDRLRYSAAMRTSGWASRTSASTWVSNCTKFF
jgi:hypothetical protein